MKRSSFLPTLKCSVTSVSLESLGDDKDENNFQWSTIVKCYREQEG